MKCKNSILNQLSVISYQFPISKVEEVMQFKFNRLMTAYQKGGVSRRTFLSLLGAISVSTRSFAKTPTPTPIPVTAINHMTVNVSDPARSREWYQGLFGMPIVARQADTVILRVGNGPQFLAIAGAATTKSRIAHIGLSTANFHAKRVLGILNEHDVTSSQKSGPMKARIRTRGPELGGARDGTPELYFGDPDGIIVQIQDTTYCGGGGRLGNKCLKTPEPTPTKGLLAVRDYNHFTISVSDRRRSVAFYQRLFRMPIDTYQGTLPILRVGAGNQFLALVGAGGRRGLSPYIHHACLTVRNFEPNRVLGALADHGVTPRRGKRGPLKPLQSYVTMRMPDRGGAPGSTPELYFTDPGGILLQIQDVRYCGGSGYLGNERGTPEKPTGRNPK